MAKGKYSEDIKKMEVDIHVDNKLQKEFVKALKNGAIKDFKYIRHGKSKQDKTKTVVFVEAPRAINFQDFNLGQELHDLKVRIKKQQKRQEHIEKQKKDPTPVRLKVPNAILREIKAIGNELGVVKYVAKQNGGETDVYFDMSMCVGRGELFERVLAIQDTINTFARNYHHKIDISYINEVVRELEAKMPDVEKHSYELMRTTGAELIELGYTKAYRVFKSRTKIGRALEYVFGKRTLEHYYMGQLVQLDKEYVYKPKFPMPCKEKINHLQECLLHYDYGQQFYHGQGVKFVERYFKQMQDLQIKAQVKQEPVSLKVEK